MRRGLPIAAFAALLWPLAALAQDPASANPNMNPNMNPTMRQDTNSAGTLLRSSRLTGAEVRNTLNEKVGTIEDLVVDTRTGQIDYAALAVGGFLGIGEKLFAIPWHSLTLKREANTNPYLVLDIDREKLKNAPGFDKNKWPDVANPNFREEIDRYYGVEHRAAYRGEPQRVDK